MSIEIECPSGLKGIVRGLTVGDGRLLTDRKLQRSGLLYDRIFSSCWVETIDPGIYKLSTSGELDWKKVLTGIEPMY